MVAAPPAAAHSAAGGLDATNYLTRLDTVRPDVPGVRFRVIETGNRLELRNTTDETVLVKGYQDEPYLRIDRRGVFENVKSPATYLNADRNQTKAPPPSADPETAPEWRKVSSDPVARWHDHRAHWMLDDPPRPVRQNPTRRHQVFEWQVPFEVGSQPVVARGDLVWVPGSSSVPWLALAAVALAATVAAALSSAWAPALAALLALLVVSDVVHAVGVQWAGEYATGTRVARLLGSGFFSVIGWVAGVTGVWMLLRRRPDGLLLAAVAGLLGALFGGIVDLGDLSKSQLPFAFPAVVGRFTVALSLGLGLGLVAGAVLALRRIGPIGDDDAEERGAVPA